MNSPESERFEVKVSRGKVAVAAIAIFALACIVAFLMTLSKAPLEIVALPLIAMATLGASFANLWLWPRPICVINDEGVTDYGFFSQGFGLIRWRNIQGVDKFEDRTGTSLLVKVNNFDELIERRHPLMRPFFALNGTICNFLGGQILLPISYSEIDAETVWQQIYHYGEHKTQLAPPLKGFERFKMLLAFGACTALLACTVIAGGIGAYWLWQHLRNPSLTILVGDNGSYGERRGKQIPMGKQAFVQEYILRNYGQDTTGLQVEITGDAFDNKLLKNPQLLVEFADKAQAGDSYVAKKNRELVPLVEGKKNLWRGISKRAFIGHQDDILKPFQVFSGYYTNGIGWRTSYTDFDPCVKIQLFVDVQEKGNGSVSLKVAPIACPGGAASNLTKIATSGQKLIGAPIFSVDVPKYFPVTAYPGSQILWLAASHVCLDSIASPADISAYYKDELNRKGWSTSIKMDYATNELILRGSKGKRSISIQMKEIPHHTPIEILTDSQW